MKYDDLVNKEPLPEQPFYPICHYCGEKHATDIICQKMFVAHASPFTRLCQSNPTDDVSSGDEGSPNGN